ncbi:MAG: sulfite exporter TauE/SafE family protein, partial [Rubritepida sp.]|nr:sulfite exporter TauE/SafE family protein [Rubritepida sp.]
MDHLAWLGLLALAMGATGLFSGLLAGLFGVGGGIVIVPVLFYILPLFDVP